MSEGTGRELLPGEYGGGMRFGLLQLLPLFLGEQGGPNLPADIKVVFTRRGDLETLFQQGFLDVRVEHGVRCFDRVDIGGSEKSRNRVGEEVVLNPGFAVWVGDEVVADVCTSGLGGIRCRINGKKANGPTLVLENIERRGRFAIGFLYIEKVRSGHCLLDPAFEVGAIDPKSNI